MTLRDRAICYRCDLPAVKPIALRLIAGDKYVCMECHFVNFRKPDRALGAKNFPLHAKECPA